MAGLLKEDREIGGGTTGLAGGGAKLKCHDYFCTNCRQGAPGKVDQCRSALSARFLGDGRASDAWGGPVRARCDPAEIARQLGAGHLTVSDWRTVWRQLPNDRAIFLFDLCRFWDYADEAGLGKLRPLM